VFTIVAMSMTEAKMATKRKRPMSQRLAVRIDDDLGKALRRAAKRERTPTPVLVRNALEDRFCPARAASSTAA
jgi:predicted transcriptional regulator